MAADKSTSNRMPMNENLTISHIEQQLQKTLTVSHLEQALSNLTQPQGQPQSGSATQEQAGGNQSSAGNAPTQLTTGDKE
jgi:hypothetical protein